MPIKVLVENDNIIGEHDLSLMINYNDIKILLDIGQSNLSLKW